MDSECWYEEHFKFALLSFQARICYSRGKQKKVHTWCQKQKPINAYNVRLGTKKFYNLASSIQHPPSMLVFFPKAALKSAVDKNINIPKAFNTYSSWRKFCTLGCLIKDPYDQSKRFSPMPCETWHCKNLTCIFLD